MYSRMPLCGLLDSVQDPMLALQMSIALPVFAGVFSAWLGPGEPGIKGWRGLDVAAAAAQGMPGCLEGSGSCQVPGAEGSLCFRTLEAGELSCRVDTNPLRDTVSPGYHLGSCSAADAFGWEMQHQKSTLLESKWLWNSCTMAK